MRPLFIVLLIAIPSLSLQAQSVKETKSWIVDKLTRYQQEVYGGKLSPCESYTQNYGFSFKFKKDTLIVGFNVRVLYPPCYTGDKVKEAKNYAKKSTVKIPVADISEVTSISRNFETKLMISTKRQTIRVIAVYADSTAQGYTNLMFVGVNFGTEDRLLERLQEAFNHLRSFYPERKRSDLF